MVFLTGDTHGILEMKKFAPGNFPQGQTLSRDDFVIILGDFGLFWSDPPLDQELEELAKLEAMPWTTLFLDGNHENFDLLDSLPEEKKFGAPAGVAAPHVFHLKRGYVYSIGGRKCFVFGGAKSLDRNGRTAGKSWWRREIPSEEEYRRGLDSLEKEDWSVDWVLTHTAPNAILRKTNLYKYLEGDPVSAYLDEIQRETRYEKWFCGHIHRNRFFQEDRFFVLKENIINGETGETVSLRHDRPSFREYIRRCQAGKPLEGD